MDFNDEDDKDDEEEEDDNEDGSDFICLYVSWLFDIISNKLIYRIATIHIWIWIKKLFCFEYLFMLEKLLSYSDFYLFKFIKIKLKLLVKHYLY